MQINGHGYDDHDHDESGALVEYLTGESKSTRKKSVPFHSFSNTNPTRTDLGENRSTGGEEPLAIRLNRPQHVQTELGNVSIGWHRRILAAQ